MLKLAIQINSLTHYTKGTLSHKNAPTVYTQNISISISTKPLYIGCYFIFPSRYFYTIGHVIYLGLTGGSVKFRQATHNPPYSNNTSKIKFTGQIPSMAVEH